MARPKNPTLHDERRHQILMAASRVFRTKGFHAARTEEICAEAGLSAGSVFRYFTDKAEIIATIAEMEYAAGYEQIHNLSNREGFLWMARMTAKDWPALLCESEFKLGADSWLELYRNPRYRERTIQADCEMRKVFAAALRKGQKEGWVRAELNVQGAASLLISLCVGLLFDKEANPKLNWTAKAKAMADLTRCYILAEGMS